MQRRDFIKKYVGVDHKTILLWAGILLAVFIFLKIDFSQIGSNLNSIIKTSLIIGGVFIALILVMILLTFLVTYIVDLLPSSLRLWFKKNGAVILNVIAALGLLYIVYEAFRKERYSFLIVMFLYWAISYVFNRNSEAEKS